MSYHGLIGGEQDACRYIHITVTQGTDRHIRQQLGVIPFCLIDQLYTVGQEQHILHPVVPHQHVYERDADTCLSRTGSHYQQSTAVLAVVMLANRFNHPLLVVTVGYPVRNLQISNIRPTTLRNHTAQLINGMESHYFT